MGSDAVRAILITNLSPKLTLDDLKWMRTLTEPYPLEKIEWGATRQRCELRHGAGLLRERSAVDEIAGPGQLPRALQGRRGRARGISLASMKKLELKKMTAERRAVVVKSLRAYLRQVMLAHQFKGVMSQKIRDPKQNMMQRIQDAEREATKVKELAKRAEKAEAREAELRAQLRALRDIEADPEFSKRFDARVMKGT